MKFITVEVKVDNDVDVYSDTHQQGLVDGVKTMESVLDARVVGVSEGPDPEPAPAADADNPATDDQS